eukprot:2361360-Prymnesium_polylepis.1
MFGVHLGRAAMELRYNHEKRDHFSHRASPHCVHVSTCVLIFGNNCRVVRAESEKSAATHPSATAMQRTWRGEPLQLQSHSCLGSGRPAHVKP